MPWPTPKNSLKCYQVIDVNLEARLAILVIFTCCSPELLKQCHLGMGNVNACVLKTVLLFILSRYLIDRLWVSIVSSFNHQIAAISALLLVLSAVVIPFAQNGLFYPSSPC